ncbi:unnamed protein product [Discosporangium mesarthrocarpum]
MMQTKRVNQDELKSLARCQKVAKEYLRQGKSVVIDSTNATRHHRKEWVRIALEEKASPRCLFFTTPKVMHDI